MQDLSSKIKQITESRKAVLAQLEKFVTLQSEVSEEVADKFKEEYQQNKGEMAGLEDFYMLNNILKRNTSSVKNACELIRRMKSISGFDVSEEAITNAEIDALMNK